MTYYGTNEQDRHYRTGARDRGCTCPDDQPAHTHRIDCVLYVVPGGVPAVLHDHDERAGEGSRGGEDRRPTGSPLVPDAPSPAELHEELDKAHDSDTGRPWL